MSLSRRASRSAVGRVAAAGYTMVEMMIVVVIIGVLIALLVPSFLRSKDHAQNRAVQSNLRSSFANAKSLFSDTESYASVTAAALHRAEPSLSFTDGPSTAPHIVSVVSTADFVVLAARSDSGLCFAIGDDPTAGGTVFANLGDVGCDAAAAPSLPAVAPRAEHAQPGGAWANDW